jgi:S1-C subfamily serine protease
MSVCVVKPYGVVGLQLQDVTSGTGAKEHVVRPGARISAVVPAGPADQAGLKAGDILVALNGNPVKNTAEFVSSIFAMKPGSVAKVGYIRNGNEETMNVIVGDGSKPFPSPARH